MDVADAVVTEEKKVYLGFKGMADAVLDDNNRLSIPAKYRENLGKTFVACCAPGPYPCLYFFPTQNWDDLCTELNDKNSEVAHTPELEWMRRNLYKNSEDYTMDAKGRFTLLSSMCKYAGLKDEVIVIGNMKRLEIWDPDTYAAAEAASQPYNTGSIPDLNY